MCDFQVGDEVVCVSTHPEDPAIVQVGQHYHVVEVWPPWLPLPDGMFLPCWAIQLREVPRIDDEESWGLYASCFRKVQRRDIGKWLEQSVGNTDRLDKSVKTPAKETA